MLSTMLRSASPLEIAALWRLGLLTGDDISKICLRWLEEELDYGDADIADFAGTSGLQLRDAGPPFERFLERLTKRSITWEEAVLIALHMHLATALQDEDFLEGVSLVIARFAGISDRTLVRNPRRDRDHPEGVYAEEELGLEYIYSGHYAFDDIQDVGAVDRQAAVEKLTAPLREDVRELRDHLAGVLMAGGRVA